jgi:hypothetical protein
MVFGLIFFTMADTQLNPNFEFYGVSLGIQSDFLKHLLNIY